MTLRIQNSTKLQLVLTICGLLVSLWLTYLHVQIHLNPFYESICAVGRIINCDSSAASRFSTAFGMPISVWGSLFYLFYFSILISSIIRKKDIPNSMTIPTILSSAAMFVSVVYLFITAYFLKSICIGCFVLHTINFTLAVQNLVQARKVGNFYRHFKDDFTKIAKSPWILVQTGAFFILVLIAGPLGGFPRYWETSSFRTGPTLPHGINEKNLPWLGAVTPDLTIEEFFDYECPACRSSHKKLRKLLEDKQDRIRVERNDMSRVECIDKDGQGLENRCVAARAAFCASIQNRFWEFNDAFIADPRPEELGIRREHVLEIARLLRLDEKIFENCLDRSDTYHHVQQIHEYGLKKDVKATPTYFVNEKKMRSKELISFIKTL